MIAYPVFDGILRYELCAAERYRRYVSLVLLHSPTDHEGLKGTIGSQVRKSDAVASYDHSVAILMAETDKGNALCAVNRYNELLGGQFDVRYSVATYPGDDTSADSLFEAAEKRLNKAKQGDGGHVVFQD